MQFGEKIGYRGSICVTCSFDHPKQLDVVPCWRQQLLCFIVHRYQRWSECMSSNNMLPLSNLFGFCRSLFVCYRHFCFGKNKMNSFPAFHESKFIQPHECIHTQEHLWEIQELYVEIWVHHNKKNQPVVHNYFISTGSYNLKFVMNKLEFWTGHRYICCIYECNSMGAM